MWFQVAGAGPVFGLPLDSFHRSIPINPVARRKGLRIGKNRTLENRKGAAHNFLPQGSSTVAA